MERDKEDTQGYLRTHSIMCVYTVHADIHAKL